MCCQVRELPDEIIWELKLTRALALVFRLSFEKLFSRLSTSVQEEWAVLLFYTLLLSNNRFREFVYSKSDLGM